MSTALEDELATALAVIAGQREIITCWRTMHLPGELHFVPLPTDMLAIITASEDYRELVAGDPPTLLEMANGNDAVELTAYRAMTDGQVYMLAPINSKVP